MISDFNKDNTYIYFIDINVYIRQSLQKRIKHLLQNWCATCVKNNQTNIAAIKRPCPFFNYVFKLALYLRYGR